jgi:nucleoside-diphosphate-sugar epimerase
MGNLTPTVMTERLLIVGGTGFIGRNLIKGAVKQGFDIVVLSLNAPDDKKKISGVVYIQADITDFIQLKNRLPNADFDYVINLSGYINHCQFLKGGRQVIDTHFSGVQNLLQTLDFGALKRFVQIGSSDEYGNQQAPQTEEMRESPISPYSLGKVSSTHLLQMLYRTERLPVVILRLFLVYGPGQDRKRFLPQVINGCLSDSSFSASKGEQLRDFCYVDDISRGILMSLKNDEVNGEVINLASGEPITIRETINMVQRIVGYGKPEFGKVPYRKCENMALFADISKAKELLKWTPEVAIEDGLRRTISYQLSNTELQ